MKNSRRNRAKAEAEAGKPVQSKYEAKRAAERAARAADSPFGVLASLTHSDA